MTETPEHQDINILDLLATLIAGRRLILVGTLVVTIAAGGLSLLLPDEYESVVQLLPPKEAKKGFGFADLLFDLPIPSLRLGEKGTPADIFIAILESPTMRRRMVKHFDLMTVYETDSMEDALEAIDGRTEIGKSEQGTIMIAVTDLDPQRATDMANQYAVFLNNRNQELSKEAASERFDFISQLQAQEDLKLQDYMEVLQTFQEEHNAISIQEQARATIKTAAEMQMSAMELVIKRLSLLQSLSPTHPEVQRLEREALMRQEALTFLRDGAQSQAESAQRRGIMDGMFLEENLFLPLRDIPRVAQESANIEKDVIVQGALMKMLLEQKAEALIEKGNTTSTVQVLDRAMVPEKPAGPRRLLMTFIAAILGGFSSIVYVLSASYVVMLRTRWNNTYGQA